MRPLRRRPRRARAMHAPRKRRPPVTAVDLQHDGRAPVAIATLPERPLPELGRHAGRLPRAQPVRLGGTVPAPRPRPDLARSSPAPEPVVVTGAALGPPGTERVFDDDNLGRILDGQQFIGRSRRSLREAMADKHITRLVKSEDGEPRFEAIDSAARRHQAGRPRRCHRPRQRVRRRRRPRQRPRRLHTAGHRRRLRRAPRRRHPAGACATRRPPSVPSSPSAGACPTRCATTPA